MRRPYFATCSQCGRYTAIKFFRFERNAYFMCQTCVMGNRHIAAIVHRGKSDNDRDIMVYDHTHSIPSRHMYAIAMRWVIIYRNTFEYVGGFDKRSRVPMSARTNLGTIHGTIERTTDELVVNLRSLEESINANQIREQATLSDRVENN